MTTLYNDADNVTFRLSGFYQVQIDGFASVNLMVAGRRPSAWTPNRGETVTGVRIDSDGDFLLMVRGLNRGVETFREVEFGANGFLKGSVALTLAQVIALETAGEYGTLDLNLDGEVGAGVTEIFTEGAGGLKLVLQGGQYKIVDSADNILDTLTVSGNSWTPTTGTEVVGIASLAGGGYGVVEQGQSVTGPYWIEARFSDTGARIASSTLSEFQLVGREAVYARDINGDGDIGHEKVGDRLDRTDPGAPDLNVGVWRVAGDAYGIGTVAATTLTPIVTSRGAPWDPGAAYAIVGARADGSNFRLILEYTAPGGEKSYLEMTVTASGGQLVAGTTFTSVADRALVAAETAYGDDLNGDGTVGDTDVIAARLDSSDADTNTGRPDAGTNGDRGIYRLESGAFVIADQDGVAGQLPTGGAVYLTSGGAAWAPVGETPIAVRAVGDGTFNVVTQGTPGTFFVYSANASGAITTAKLPMDVAQRVQVERAFDQDFNGDGFIGDTVAARLDLDGIRADAGGRAIYEGASGATFVSTDVTETAGNFIHHGEQAGTVLIKAAAGLTNADGVVWESVFTPIGGELAGVRETATGYVVLTEVTTNNLDDYYEQTINKATGIVQTAPLKVTLSAELEARYMRDLNGDGEIDLTGVSFSNPADYFIAPTALDLGGETVRMTIGQFNALTGQGGGINGTGTVILTLDTVAVGDDFTIDGTAVGQGVDVELVVEAPDGVVVAVTENPANTFRIKGFDDIQEAIDDSDTMSERTETTGTDIFVGAGEYESPRLGYIDVNKEVHLFGAQAGNGATADARDGGESVISQSEGVDSGWEFVWASRPGDNVIAGTAASPMMVRVSVDDVTIDGFTFTDFHRDAINVRSIETTGSPDLSDITIANNRIVMEGTKGNSFTDPAESRYNQYNAIVFGEGVGDPIRSGLEPTFSDMEVSGNYIDITHVSNTYSGARGLILTNHFNQGAGLIYDGFVVSNNTFNTYFDMFVSGTVGKTFFVNGEITDNNFGGSRGLTGTGFDGATVTGNTFSNSSYGVSVGATDSTFSDNSFAVTGSSALVLLDETEKGGVVSAGNTVTDNTFDMSAGTQTAYRAPGDELADVRTGVFEANTFSGQPVILIEPTGIHAGPTEKAAMLAAGAGAEIREGVLLIGNGTVERTALLGTAGEDSFIGEAGDQVYAGFGEADSFDFCVDGDIGNDLIVDFGNGLDKLKVASGMKATIEETDAGLVVSDPSFTGSVTLDGLTTSYYVDSDPYTQGFEESTAGFRDVSSNWFGGITRVASGTDGVTSEDGGWHAQVTSANNSFGPASSLGGIYKGDFVERTVAMDIWLDPDAWADDAAFHVGLNSRESDGDFRQDFFFHVVKGSWQSPGGGSENAIRIGADNNAYANNTLGNGAYSDPITKAGWYTFSWTFRAEETELPALEGETRDLLAVDFKVAEAATPDQFIYDYERLGTGTANTTPEQWAVNTWMAPQFIDGFSEGDVNIDPIAGPGSLYFYAVETPGGVVAIDNVRDFIDRAVDREFIEPCDVQLQAITDGFLFS